jgi:hypothetical protein
MIITIETPDTTTVSPSGGIEVSLVRECDLAVVLNVGIAGPPGATGPTGPTGPQGPVGPIPNVDQFTRTSRRYILGMS